MWDERVGARELLMLTILRCPCSRSTIGSAVGAGWAGCEARSRSRTINDMAWRPQHWPLSAKNVQVCPGTPLAIICAMPSRSGVRQVKECSAATDRVIYVLTSRHGDRQRPPSCCPRRGPVRSGVQSQLWQVVLYGP